MHAFHHHDGIVHHNGNGQHHGRKRQQVEREADHVEQEEGTNQGYRDGNGRNERAAEVLQEEEHHDKHEDKRLDKRLDHFVDRGKEEVVYALGHFDFHTFGQILPTVFKQGFDVLYNLCGVGAGNLHHDTRYGTVSVHAAGEGVGAASQFHLGHILHPYHIAVSRGTDNHVLKVGCFAQAAFVAQGILEGLVFSLTDGTGSRFDVLFRQNAGNVRRHQVVFRHFFGIQPDTHGIVGTHHHGVAHTLDTLHLGDDVDFGVVLDKVGRIFIGHVHDGENYQHGALAFLRNHTDLGNFRRQQALCLGHTVLHVHRSHIRVGALFESNVDGGVTGVGG